MCALNVEDENSKLGILCSGVGMVGTCRGDQGRGGCGRGRTGAGAQAGSHHSHEPGIPDSESAVTLETKSRFRSP